MAHKSIIIFAMLFALITSHDAHSQWVQTGGPYGGYVYEFAKIGTHVFVASINGVFRSDDQAKTWKSASVGLPKGSIINIITMGNILFATSFGKIYRSDDVGQSWKFVHSFASPISTIYAYRNKVFVSFYESAVAISDDSAVTWKDITGKIPGSKVFTFTSHANKLYAGAEDGVYESIDTGKSWKLVVSTFRTNVISVTDSELYVAQSYEHLTCFIKNDTVWKKLNDAFNTIQVNALLVYGDSIFAASDSGLFVTKLRGDIWSKTDNGIEHSLINCLGSIESTLLVGKNDDGIFASIDSGKLWRESNEGFVAIRVNEIMGHNGTIFAGTDEKGLFRSTDQGDHWIKSGLGFTLALQSYGSLVFASYVDYLYVSSDDGLSWNGVHISSKRTSVLAMTVYGNNLYIGSENNGIWYSSDSGITWHAMMTNSNLTGVISLAVNNVGVFATTFTSGVYYSPHPDSIWTRVLYDADGTYYYASAASDSVVYIGGERAIFRAKINGKTMTPFDSISSIARTFSLLMDANNIISASAVDGIHISNDNGNSWNSANEGLPDSSNATAIAKLNNTFYAGIGPSGVWKRDAKQLAVPTQKQSSSISLTTSPNPLTQTTTITFATREHSQTKVSIYDLLGNEIAVLFNGSLDPGQHSYQWNASNAPQGMYHCVVRIGSETKEIPMVVVR